MINVLAANDIYKLCNDFFGVLLMEIFDMALITHLRPSADFRTVRLRTLDLFLLYRMPAFERVNMSRIGISQNHRICRILIQKLN